jgi:hypothetical protein
MVVADVNADGRDDIVFFTKDGEIYVYDASARSLLSGWPVDIGNNLWSEEPVDYPPRLVVGNIHPSEGNEVIISDLAGYIHAFDSTGSEIVGWPRQLSMSNAQYLAILADIDADGFDEVIASRGWDWDDDGGLYLLEGDGSNVVGDWPKLSDDNFQVQSTNPVITDIDADGELEIGAYVSLSETSGKSPDYGFFFYNADGSVVNERLMQEHYRDEADGGIGYGYYNSNLLSADADGDGKIDLVAISGSQPAGIHHLYYFNSKIAPGSIEWNGYYGDMGNNLRFLRSILPAPSLVNPKEGDLTRRIVMVVWEPLENAVTYELEVSRYEDFHNVYYTKKEITKLYHLPKRLFYRGRWYWRIRGIDAKGKNGVWSSSYFIVK